MGEAALSLSLKVFDDFSHRFSGSFRTQKTPNNKDTYTAQGWEEVRVGKMLWGLVDFAHLLAPLSVYGLALQDESRHSGPIISCVHVPVYVGGAHGYVWRSEADLGGCSSGTVLVSFLML